jgi:hypothetical protein
MTSFQLSIPLSGVRRFISRAAFFTFVTFILLFSAYGTGSTSTQGEFAELLFASNSPVWYHLVGLLDTFVWLGIGATLCGFGLLSLQNPIRSIFIFMCAFGQSVGALGGFMRAQVIGPLGIKFPGYSAETEQFMREIYLNSWDIINSAYNFGSLLYGTAFLALALAPKQLFGFSTWLRIWLGVSALAGLSLTVLTVFDVAVPDGIGLLHLALNVMGLHLGICISFRGRVLMDNRSASHERILDETRTIH